MIVLSKVLHKDQDGVYYERKETTVRTEVYDTWWDHFKASMPRWMYLKWKTRTITYNVRFDVLYPNFKPAVPDEVVVIRAAEDAGVSITEVYKE